MRSKQIEEYKKTLKFTKKQKEILIGLILGDGHLETLNNGKTYRLKVEHSLKQREYLDWLYLNFKEWINKTPEVRKRTSLGKIVETYGFTTYTSGILRFYAQQFYQNKKKIIPKMIDKIITPQSLAIWFMDDGSIKSKAHKALVIHTHGYSKNDLLLITKVLEKKFGLKIGLQKQYDKWRLYIFSESVDNFKKIILPYILPSMQYKLGNKNA
jgi:predicted transcriptional regulator